MSSPIKFILNNRLIATDASQTSILLDYLRYEESLPGTKIGCREGDCGACCVLIGELQDSIVKYQTITSCLTPLGNVNGKHIVTIEGLNLSNLSPIQKSIVDYGGTQCGACTPGFIVSLAAFSIESDKLNLQDGLNYVDGNICRCTGYQSIKKAIDQIALFLNDNLSEVKQNRVNELIKLNFLPKYFSTIFDLLQNLPKESQSLNSTLKIGGGTDLYVQIPDDIQTKSDATFLCYLSNLKFIKIENDHLEIGAGCSATEIMESKIVRSVFPDIFNHFKLIGSTPIRNLMTLGGNIVNASPIADMVLYFMATDPSIVLQHKNLQREIQFSEFYTGYKQVDLKEGELVYSLKIPIRDHLFNFEKVSKRTYLDIASVNTAISISLTDENVIEYAGITAGGIGPVPKFFSKSSEYLIHKNLTSETILELLSIIDSEISPISDIRGSAEYKRMLLRQLIVAHFNVLTPELFELEVVL